MYSKVCEARFNRIETKVDDLRTIVKNGLGEKVKMATRLSWWTLGIMVTLLIGIVTLIISTYLALMNNIGW